MCTKKYVVEHQLIATVPNSKAFPKREKSSQICKKYRKNTIATVIPEEANTCI
jgi:hypothetical protein